jgi:hypothetical protein
MDEQESKLSEKESLALIATMISKAKDSYHDTGVGAIMWGAVVAFCALEKLAEIHFGYKLPFDIYYLTALAIIPQIFISIKEKRERKVKSYDDAFMSFLWMGFGIAIFLLTMVINSVFSAWNPVYDEYSVLTGHQPSFRFYTFIAPFFLMLYGLPTFVTGAAYRFKPMILGSIFCWVSCIITIYTNIKIDLLLTAASAVFAWLIPGVIIEQGYRKAKRELKQVNV